MIATHARYLCTKIERALEERRAVEERIRKRICMKKSNRILHQMSKKGFAHTALYLFREVSPIQFTQSTFVLLVCLSFAYTGS